MRYSPFYTPDLVQDIPQQNRVTFNLKVYFNLKNPRFLYKELTRLATPYTDHRTAFHLAEVLLLFL